MAQRCSREEWEIAKRWGMAHGYRGSIGGWIYDPEGNPAAQGWGTLMSVIGKDKIMDWAVRSGTMQEVTNVGA